MNQERIKMVANALKQSFKDTVSANSAAFNDGTPLPFDSLGIALPKNDIWERYALVAIKADPDSLPVDHVIIEQADYVLGGVHQTVQNMSDNSEYIRVVDPLEAYKGQQA